MIPLRLADRSNGGINAIAPAHPINGITNTTAAVLIATPTIIAGMKLHFFWILFIKPIDPPAKAMLRAIGK